MKEIKISVLFAAVLIAGASAECLAQTAAPNTQSTEKTPPARRQQNQQPPRRRPVVTTQNNTMVLAEASNAPQVVTLLHRLSGLKMVRMLSRMRDVRAIAGVNEGFTFSGQVYTNVIAGLTLDDGETIAAWLPEMDAEVSFAPPPPPPPKAPAAPGPHAEVLSLYEALAKEESFKNSFFSSPDISVVVQDQRPLAARYIGLDGVTGVSVLRVNRAKAVARPAPDAKEETIKPGQRVRLLAPEPVLPTPATPTAPRAVYVRLGETEGKIKQLMRAPSGGLARLNIVSENISPANIGGVALNEAGETLGIVESVKGSEATVIPAGLVRGAAKRVLERKASVPRPWLGVRGEPLGAFSLEQMTRNGWQAEKYAQTLADRARGILVTSVAPASPAAAAALKPGDLILRINNDEIRNAEDFSFVLEENSAGSLLQVEVARPGQIKTEAIEIKLSEAPDPFFGLIQSRTFQTPKVFVGPNQMALRTSSLSGALLLRGVETLTIRPRAATLLGSPGGLLVTAIRPDTIAERAGLRTGDLIEAIDGKPVLGNLDKIKLEKPGVSYSFSVIRNRERLVIAWVNPEL